MSSFFEYLVLELGLVLNLDLLRRILKSRAPRMRRRLPQFSWEDIEQVVEYCQNEEIIPTDDPKERLRALRDRAFIHTLADTGLLVHEACNLARGDFDWNRSVAPIAAAFDHEPVFIVGVIRPGQINGITYG